MKIHLAIIIGVGITAIIAGVLMIELYQKNSIASMISSQPAANATKTVVLNGTEALDACSYLDFPCPQHPSFIAQKFGSGTYVVKTATNGRDYYMLLGGPDTCIYPGIDGHESCSNPDDIAILKLAGANIVNISEDIDTQNHTLTLGDLKYEIAPFEPNRTVNLDGMTFVYKGSGSAIRGDCYGTWVNQTEGRSFSIYGGNEFGENAFQCWPPLQYPTQIEENGKLLDVSPLLYSISFFDINQTTGIAWCSSDNCTMGDGFYLVKQGWNTPTIYDSPSVLKFYIQENSSVIHTGQTIGVDIGDNNTQPRPVRLPFPWHYGFQNSRLFPCDYKSTRIGVFQGYLTQENLNSEEPLDFYHPGMYSCPAPSPGKTWVFQTLSNVATLQCAIGEYCNDTRTMSQHISLDGYWDSSDHFHLFEEGNYTLAGGDQWGHLEILHFVVDNSTVASPSGTLPVQENNGTFTGFSINYTITGGYNEIVNATLEEKQNSLVLSLESSTNGTLTVIVPRALLDSKSAYSNQDTQFIVLINGQEIKYKETTSMNARALTMPFELGAKKIEIISTTGI